MLNIGNLIATVLELYLFVLFARNWRPRGIILAFAELTYSLTDKPLFFIRRFIPPLRLGAVSLDLSFVVLFFGIQILIGLIN